MRRIWTFGRHICVAALGFLASGPLHAQPQTDLVPVPVSLVENTDDGGGHYALLSGLAPPGGVSLNLPYAAITSPIRMMIINETPEQTMAVEIIDSTGAPSAAGIIEQAPSLATASFRVEGEYSVQIRSRNDVPIAYTFLLWMMPAAEQTPDHIYTKRSD